MQFLTWVSTKYAVKTMLITTKTTNINSRGIFTSYVRVDDRLFTSFTVCTGVQYTSVQLLTCSGGPKTSTWRFTVCCARNAFQLFLGCCYVTLRATVFVAPSDDSCVITDLHCRAPQECSSLYRRNALLKLPYNLKVLYTSIYFLNTRANTHVQFFLDALRSDMLGCGCPCLFPLPTFFEGVDLRLKLPHGNVHCRNHDNVRQQSTDEFHILNPLLPLTANTPISV